ncbi:hypothetical protein SAMN05216552_1010157 [Pseudoduganella namucuonensis]|uniref:Uncharacterized protein n=1 Tax=Pseudoduganella namucuonensis TaxID=1035707 RepID=A0A1I7J8W3_9BURK|nr:hypothetical protein SAMN05216552_1010157 [Pseudoduganella namucuonensis]
MTSIATKLETDSQARAKTVSVVIRLMGIGAGLSVVALCTLLYRIF